METQFVCDDWVTTGMVDRIEELNAEVTSLRAQRDEMETELVVAKRWVALLAAEVDRTRAELTLVSVAR